MAKVLDVDAAFPNRVGDWVLIDGITEGNWGVSCVTVGIREIHDVTKGSADRIP